MTLSNDKRYLQVAPAAHSVTPEHTGLSYSSHQYMTLCIDACVLLQVQLVSPTVTPALASGGKSPAATTTMDGGGGGGVSTVTSELIGLLPVRRLAFVCRSVNLDPLSH